MAKCEYRNCDNEVIGRTNKHYCKEQCRRCEKKYRQREKKKLEENAKEN